MKIKEKNLEIIKENLHLSLRELSKLTGLKLETLKKVVDGLKSNAEELEQEVIDLYRFGYDIYKIKNSSVLSEKEITVIVNEYEANKLLKKEVLEDYNNGLTIQEIMDRSSLTQEEIITVIDEFEEQRKQNDIDDRKKKESVLNQLKIEINDKYSFYYNQYPQLQEKDYNEFVKLFEFYIVMYNLVIDNLTYNNIMTFIKKYDTVKVNYERYK